MDEDLELHEFLDINKKAGQNHTSFAKSLGIPRSFLSKIKDYKEGVSPAMAMKIQEKTGGKVKWYKLIEKYREKRCTRN